MAGNVWRLAKWAASLFTPRLFRQESAFYCDRCQNVTYSRVDRTVQARDAKYNVLPGILRERHCVYCNATYHTWETRLPAGWNEAGEFNPPAVPKEAIQLAAAARRRPAKV